MANNINWGKIYESTAWGSGVDNNISWGKVYEDLGGDTFTGLLDTYSGAAAAYSLRQLSSTYSGDAIVVRRASDNTTQNIGFVNNELDTASLESFVKGGNVFTNPDITSATAWTIGANTTYNSSTEAFDLLNENGLTLRQGKAVNGHTYAITIVVDSITSGGIKVYAGGTQSDSITTAGTHTLNITASSSNNILGLNPLGIATASISSFYAVDTSADGFVTTWYDQSGNGNDAAQATASAQPKIVSSGSTIEDNGKPSVQFVSTDSLSKTGLTDFVSASFVYNFDTSQNNMIMSEFGALNNHYIFHSTSQVSFDGGVATNDEARMSLNGASLTSYAENQTGSYSINTQYHLYFNYDASKDMESSFDTLGILLSSFTFSGKMQEIIVWTDDNSSDLSGINTNINDFYSIY